MLEHEPRRWGARDTLHTPARGGRQARRPGGRLTRSQALGRGRRGPARVSGSTRREVVLSCEELINNNTNKHSTWEDLENIFYTLERENQGPGHVSKHHTDWLMRGLQ